MLLEADFQPVGDTSWFASDADGHVGFFAVFGNGRLPVHALSDDSVLDDLTKFFIGAHTTPEPKERRASGTDEWTAMANCGIFAFDGNPPARAPSYRLVASPARPVLVADLPSTVKVVVQRYRVPFCFAAQSEFADTCFEGPHNPPMQPTGSAGG